VIYSMTLEADLVYCLTWACLDAPSRPSREFEILFKEKANATN
jgi:hypothetical protein